MQRRVNRCNQGSGQCLDWAKNWHWAVFLYVSAPLFIIFLIYGLHHWQARVQWDHHSMLLLKRTRGSMAAWLSVERRLPQLCQSQTTIKRCSQSENEKLGAARPSMSCGPDVRCCYQPSPLLSTRKHWRVLQMSTTGHTSRITRFRSFDHWSTLSFSYLSSFISLVIPLSFLHKRAS